MNLEITADNAPLFETECVVHLPPQHPGLTDTEYLWRRRFLFALSRGFRLAGLSPPEVEYPEIEREVWREVVSALDFVHQESACREYLRGKALLQIDGSIPKIGRINERLQSLTGFRLSPAEGLLEPHDFFGMIGKSALPCTQYLRHHSSPLFTPEPDMVHDLIGHAPLLTDATYVSILKKIGTLALHVSEHDMGRLTRLYWFGIEFPLIWESGTLKILGAGLLSSVEEMRFALSDSVMKKPFLIEEVISTDFDPTVMQPLLFVVESIEHLKFESDRFLNELMRQYGIKI